MIKATNFYQYVKCPRRVYLHFHGDESKRIHYSDFMLDLFKKGRDYEDKIASKFKFVEPEEGNEEERFKQTVEFMKKGEKIIYQGVLIDKDNIGIPDFLIKKKGESKFGDYFYEPMDVKSGLRAKDEYAMQVCFYCYLLEKVQGFAPLNFKLFLGDESIVELDLKDYYNKFSMVFKEVKDIVKGKEANVHIFSECKECVWKDVCFETAKKNKDISLIANISRAKAETLKNLGVKDLTDASNMDVDELSKVKGLGEDSLTKWKIQAKSLLDEIAIRLKDYEFPAGKDIYFDIEDAEVDGKKIVYLFGLIFKGKYHSFVASKPEDEENVWRAFLRFFSKLDEFNIYIYSHHEKTMMKKLFDKYGGDKETYEKIVDNMIDLLVVVRQTVVFPVYSYSIKDVAKFLGFEWSAKDAGGAASMLWYDNWIKTKDDKHLRKILRYNKEDCKAMVKLKEFIKNC